MADIEGIYREFWYEPQLGATEAEIRRAEKLLHVQLPPDFVELIKISDGGTPWLSAYEHEDTTYSLHDFFNVTGTRKASASILPPEGYDAEAAGVPPGVIVFSSGPHYWFGLDYRTSEEPSVVYSDDLGLVEVARTFRDFLLGLRAEG